MPLTKGKVNNRRFYCPPVPETSGRNFGRNNEYLNKKAPTCVKAYFFVGPPGIEPGTY